MDIGNIKLLLATTDCIYSESLKNSLAAIEKVKLDITRLDALDPVLQVMKHARFDVALLDLELNKENPLKTVKLFTSSFPEIPLIIIAKDEDIQTAASSLRYGAYDYLLKSQLNSHVILTAVRYTIERKKTEKFHREQIHFLQSVMDNIPSPLYLKGIDLIFGACNLAFENILGLPKSEIIGNSVFDIFDRETSELIRKNELKLLSGENTQAYELSIPGENSKCSYFAFYETAHKRADGKLAGLIGVGVDVTDMKNKELFLKNVKEELERKVLERTKSLEQANLSLEKNIHKRKETESHLRRERNIFVNGPAIVFRCRATKENKVEYVSPNISRFGYEAEKFVSGKIDLFEIIHKEDRNRFIEEVKKHIGSRISNFESTIRIICRNSADIRKVNAYIVIVRNKKDIVTYFDGYIIDITGWDIC